jgi:GT2 family glycosyltransferase
VLRNVGLYDPKYFAYWEDTDFCTRVKQSGYRVVSVSSARVWHKGSYTARRTSGLITYFMARNRFIFMRTRATMSRYAVFISCFVLFEFWRELLMHASIPQEQGSVTAFIRGTVDGILASSN